MKINFIIPVIIFTFLLSCTQSHVQSKLLDIESYIMDRPDSALVVLEAMDRNLLVTEEDRAHHALLHAMALDKNFIDVSNDSLARVAVDYYSENGPRKYYARSLYYLGVAYYYQGEYNKAIVEFTNAEQIAAGNDLLYLAMTKSSLSDTYAQCYNYVEELKYLREANQIFEDISDNTHVYSTRLELIHSLYNLNLNDEADSLLNELLLREDVDDYIQILIKSTQAFNIVTNHSSPDFNKVIQIYDEVFNSRYGERLSIKDYWAYAYSLNALRRTSEAHSIISQLASVESGTSSYWQYLIAKADNNLQSALAHLEDYMKYNDVEVSDALKQSLALSQRDFFESQAELSKLFAEKSRLWLLVVLMSSLIILILTIAVIMYYVRRQKSIKERYILYISEIRHQLEEAKYKDYPALQQKYLSIYKSKFATIGELCDQYVQSQGLINAEKSIYKKVVALVDEFTRDYTNREKFEAMLDKDLDNIMSNIRKEMPSLKEKDYIIFSFLVIGFDVTTISNLLNVTANTVYIRKSRIKTHILEQDPTHKDSFLAAIG